MQHLTSVKSCKRICASHVAFAASGRTIATPRDNVLGRIAADSMMRLTPPPPDTSVSSKQKKVCLRDENKRQCIYIQLLHRYSRTHLAVCRLLPEEDMPLSMIFLNNFFTFAIHALFSSYDEHMKLTWSSYPFLDAIPKIFVKPENS